MQTGSPKGQLAAVKALVEARADVNAVETSHDGARSTVIEWAHHYHPAIEAYLRQQGAKYLHELEGTGGPER